MGEAPCGKSRSATAVRRGQIGEYARRHGFVRVEDLAAWLKMSLMTARRELTKLEGQGIVRRVHGGAVAVSPLLAAPHIAERRRAQVAAKAAIARQASSLLRSGERIFLDAGSSCAALAEVLPEDLDLTVITHSLDAMSCIAHKVGVHLIALGGDFDPAFNAFVGPLTEAQGAAFNVDKAFLGVSGVDYRKGFGINTTVELGLKKRMSAQASERYALADAAKFGRPGFYSVFAPTWDGTVITDAACDPAYLRACRKRGLRVVVAPP